LPQQLRVLAEQQHRDAILNRWPDVKLGVLDGRSPREAAGDETRRVRLLAAILVLEHWAARLPGCMDFNELRAKLGLPLLEPIDPKSRQVAELPISRLGRLDVEKLPDQELIVAYYRARAYANRPAMRKFAKAIVHRPSLSDSAERRYAYATLAHTEEDLTRALEYVDQGRREAEAKKASSASWDLMELSLRFAAHDVQGAMRLVEHLHQQHINEPGVGEALTRMLIDVGLLNPDGTPAFDAGMGEPAMAAAEGAAEPPSGLWTPDSSQPGGSGGKLWTPD
jgi:hypothetical protein